MSRITNWKLEKVKVKIVFRLQFHATHIPQTGWDKLFVSFIPTDSGKVTAKTTKANVRNGTCRWADPIYETTRLLQDAKTKQYDEKLYKLVVGMGSSRSTLLGEASINLADYANALKPVVVSLPLHVSDPGAILHVTLQLLTSKTGFREFEQQRELSEKGLQPTNNHDGGKVPSSRDTTRGLIDKVNSRVKFGPEPGEIPSLEGSLNEELVDLVTAFDGSSNTSESFNAEKHDTSSIHEIDSIKSAVSGDIGGVSLSQSPTAEKGDSSDNCFAAPGTSDWVHRWGSDTSVGNDLGIAHQEDSRLRGSLEAAEESINELKQEISTLQSHADDLGAETEKLTEQLAAEIASGLELAKEVSLLKSECLRFKDDVEWLRNSKINPSLSGRGNFETNQCQLLHDSDLRWLKVLQFLEDKIRELQNKAYVASKENDFRFLFSDVEELLSVLQDLKQGTECLGSPLDVVTAGRSETGNISEMSLAKTNSFVSGASFGVDLCHPEGVLQGLSISGLVSQEGDAMNTMQGELFKLLRELDESKAEQENLARKMEQMECYYEALIQELEENQKRVLGEYQNLRNEHSTCIYTISAAKAQMEAMHEDMNEQILRTSEERCKLDSLNKELERRAITSEAALKRARLNYSIAVNQLQKDLEVLSFQVLSMYETNENFIRKAFSEALQPCLPGYPETMQSELLDGEESNKGKLVVCQSQNMGLKNQIFGGDMLLVDLKKSLSIQEELYQKIEEELCEMLLENIQLEVFARTLERTLQEATTGIALGEENCNKLMEQLELSTKSNELLMMKLQTAMDDIVALTEDKAGFMAKCNHLARDNHALEEKCRSISDDNCVFAQKLKECEAVVTECKMYKSRYEACDSARTELANLVEHVTKEKHNLSNEVSLLHEELWTLKTEFNKVASAKENLQKMVDYLQEKLGTLLVSFDGQFDELSVSGKSLGSEFEDFVDVISRLEEIQRATCRRIHQLLKEKKDLEDERDVDQSEVELMRPKFERDIPDIFCKLDALNALVQKLQEDLEVISRRLELCSQAEAKYAVINDELLSDFTHMKVELQEVTVKNGHLLHEILALGSLSEELENNKLVVAELTQDNQDLRASLQNKIDEAVLLVSELNNLKGALTRLNDELSVENGCRHRLECEVSDLTSKMKEKNEELLYFNQQKAEVVRLNELLLDLESEKSSVCHQLSCTEERLRKVLEESSISEANLQDMHELLLAADIKQIYMRMQYKCHDQELVQQLVARDEQLEELQEKHLSLDTMLEQCLATKANYSVENAVLLSTIDLRRSELEASKTQSRVFEDINNTIGAELEGCGRSGAILESRYSVYNTERDFSIEQLRCRLSCCQGETDTLMLEKEELEVRFLVLKAKLEELCSQINLQGGCNDELIMLRKQYDEVNLRLSEQIMKTEEFKNLSIHLRELNDKADAECKKREAEGSSVVMQDSLRIAFIKEQYETKLQELRHQLSISNKHGEEMLWKLQDAVDQLENRKKSETSQLKRNEELSLKVLELDAELCSVLSDNREKVKAYDQVKAELECSLISLECCKEEKQKLMVSVQECNEEKSRIEAQVNMMRGMLESSNITTGSLMDGMNGSDTVEVISSQEAAEQIHLENSSANIPGQGREAADVACVCGSPGYCSTEHLEYEGSLGFLVRNETSAPIDEREHARTIRNTQLAKGAVELRGAREISGQTLEKEYFLQNDVKDRTLIHDQLKAQSLKHSMEQLHKELERMKSENLLLSEDGLPFAPHTEGLHRELTHLERVNEELGSLSSAYNDVSAGGNSIERVLALELELAEALQAKKSSIQFQSSFLRQLSDEAAVLRSFRDINELIKDMLEIKARNSTVEMQLQEMHERYSQLSLQFAEVEGERQRLMMTLKTVRASKKLLSRSSSASIGEPIV